MSHSTVPAGIALQTHVYLAQGGVENLANLHAFLSDTVLMTGVGFEPPVAIPTWGVLECPAASVPAPTARRSRCCSTAPSSWPATPPTSRRCATPFDDAGGRPLPMYCASLRTAEPELLELLAPPTPW